MKKKVICLFLLSLFLLVGGLKSYAGISESMSHYNLAKEYFLSGEYAKAHQEFGLAAQLDQSRRKSIYRLSQIYLKKIDKLIKKKKQIEAKKRWEKMKVERKQLAVGSKQLAKKKKLAQIEERKQKKQKIEEKKQRMIEEKRRKAEEKKRIIEAKKQKIEERKQLAVGSKQLAKKITFPLGVEEKIEINQHYRQGREYFQQKKFMEAIVEFKLVKSKIDKNHPYFIPCSIYIEQAREAMGHE